MLSWRVYKTSATMNPEAKKYLNGRGITDETIERYRISGDNEKIIIPINGFNKYRTYPVKRYFYDKGFTAALFGVEQLGESPWCVLTEGELDALRLASEGVPAISGTGGAGTFKDEWISELPTLVFICYDTDKVGKDNALKVHWKTQGSRIVDLPAGKDVSEYLINHTKEQFLSLLQKARVEVKPLPVFHLRKMKSRMGTSLERAKQYPIEELIKFDRQRNAKCIWHNEKTASMHLYSDNHVYCFGCSKGDDAVGVFQTLHNLSFDEAVNRLVA